MIKYNVFGEDSNFGHFSETFTDKSEAYEYYMYRQENADYLMITEIMEVEQ